jgi:hypothetical protein
MFIGSINSPADPPGFEAALQHIREKTVALEGITENPDNMTRSTVDRAIHDVCDAVQRALKMTDNKRESRSKKCVYELSKPICHLAMSAWHTFADHTLSKIEVGNPSELLISDVRIAIFALTYGSKTGHCDSPQDLQHRLDNLSVSISEASTAVSSSSIGDIRPKPILASTA